MAHRALGPRPRMAAARGQAIRGPPGRGETPRPPRPWPGQCHPSPCPDGEPSPWARGLAWIGLRPSKPGVAGSNPAVPVSRWLPANHGLGGIWLVPPVWAMDGASDLPLGVHRLSDMRGAPMGTWTPAGPACEAQVTAASRLAWATRQGMAGPRRLRPGSGRPGRRRTMGGPRAPPRCRPPQGPGGPRAWSWSPRL